MSMHRITALVLIVLLTACGIAWWKTAPPSLAVKARSAEVTSAALVDETTYTTALKLATLPTTPEEQEFVDHALRLADHELALAFTAALRDADAHPPTLSTQAQKIEARLQASQALLDTDSQRVERLTQQVAQAKPSQVDELQDDLQLAKSQLDLDKDEVDEADQELAAAGGNPQQGIEAMLQEHDAQVKARAAGRVAPTPYVPPHGSVLQFRDWFELHEKIRDLRAAHDAAMVKADRLDVERTALQAKLESNKEGISELAQHAANHEPSASAANAGPRNHESAAALVNRTRQITADQKVLTLLERQGVDERQLAGVYLQWAAVVGSQANALMHRLLLDVSIVIVILLAVLLFDGWAQILLKNPKLDRRHVETLRTITRVTLRLVGAVVIMLILIGVPNQFGTMLGIVGAGLTVALKDFIVAFFGWLALMGRNGIRLGDWVEINGVSGEVTELGMFHTVLLETGNWSDAGHPTGRRVTFTNSFAIEKHYFNFSTSGQWLWDELQVLVPAGQDPYRVVDAITQLVTAATAEGARQAEAEWQRAVPAQRAQSFSGTPGVNVKPVYGGVEVSVRYITRAHERFQLRTKLYQAAVDLLGGRSEVRAASIEPLPAA